MNLTCTFALIKQLIEGACKAIGVTQPKSSAMERITDIMAPFSVVPEWVRLGKQSACLLGVTRGMELARAYHPGVKPELLAAGFPELKADWSPFFKDDYMKLHKETHSAGTQITNGIELSRLEASYDG